MLRTAAIASIAALATFAAIIAADFTLPAQAQSDETNGRIVARRLDDGRVEFGWQPTGGERILPIKRHFPADAQVGHWLRSSPIEVERTEIGRINARLLDDGRIESAFTPTNRGRIQPHARYVPADAPVGRWLRSTEITINPPPEDDAPRYTALSAGSLIACTIRENGTIVCWGDNRYGQTDAPAGRFTAVSTGGYYACAIREDGAIECWGDNRYGQTDAPVGRFTTISAGARD